jgi:Leucine-rich repeat (LRR) protein
MDPKVTSIIAAGYSEAKAKEALATNNGDVDDAIDYLFLKGRRKSQRNVASSRGLDEDVTIIDDCLAPSAAAASSVAIIESRKRPSVRDNSTAAARRSSASARDSRTLNDVDIETGLIPPLRAPPVDDSNHKGLQTEEKKDADSVGADATSKSFSGAARSSFRQHVKGTTSEPHAHAAGLPGAFAIVSNSTMAHNDNDESIAVSIQPSLRDVTTAELVDPDQENQILEQRLQEELKRKGENAAVAEVEKESELKKCPWRRVFCVVGVVSVAFVVALSLSLKFARPKTVETAAPTPAPTPAPMFDPLPQELINLIAPVSFDGGESLMDPYSPQSAAARWLEDNAQLRNYTDQRKLQRYALATFYFSSDGDAWKDKQKWLSDSNECTDWWQSEFNGNEDVKLDCDGDNAIKHLYVQDNNLAGSIPDEIAFLSNSLFDLRLDNNQIGGKLPSALGVMTRLKALYLRGNNVTGPIPTELGLMSSLKELKLEENLLTGSIPTELVLLTALVDLQLQGNNLVGTISPTVIASLRLLDTLRLAENNFSSTIPTEIGLLSLLEELKLHRNKLVGKPIPVTFSHYFIFRNLPPLIYYTGPMPSEIGLLNMLNDFACHENELTGTLPTELGLLTALGYEFRIATNNFTGPIPSEIASLTNLGRLRMGENQLTGTILSTFGLLHPTLNSLELQSNLLTGSIPEELGLLTLMSDLRLSANNLTGTIVSEFTQFTDSKFLYFENNSLVGTIPPFGNLTRLKDFRAGFNMLTGSIPSSIDRLVSLEKLSIPNNALTGTIPKVLFNSTIFPNLLKVHLFNNSFTGDATCPPHIIDCYLSCFEEGNESCRSLP